jgi:hypothetical protein
MEEIEMNLQQAKDRARALKSRFEREFVVYVDEDNGQLYIRETEDRALLPTGNDIAIVFTTEGDNVTFKPRGNE